MTAEPESIPADGRHSSRIVAIIETGAAAMEESTVEFTTTAGRLTNATVALDEKNQAQTFLVSATEPGTATVAARYGDFKASVQVVFECYDGAEEEQGG